MLHLKLKVDGMGLALYLSRVSIGFLTLSIMECMMYTFLCVHVFTAYILPWSVEIFRWKYGGLMLLPVSCGQMSSTIIHSMSTGHCPVHCLCPKFSPSCVLRSQNCVCTLYRLYPVSWSAEILWRKWRSRFHFSFAAKTRANWFISNGVAIENIYK